MPQTSYTWGMYGEDAHHKEDIGRKAVNATVVEDGKKKARPIKFLLLIAELPGRYGRHRRKVF